MSELDIADSPIGPLAPRRLDELDASTAERICRAPAANTLIAYGRWLTHYQGWCGQRGIPPVPASAATFANYVNALADTDKGVPAIRQAIAAVRWAHAVAGYEDEPPLKQARLALRDHARKRAALGFRESSATPIRLLALQAMLDTCPPDTLRGLRDRFILVIGWTAMLRRSELVALSFPDVREVPDALVVYVARSKTDKDAKGAEVPIPRGSHPETNAPRVHCLYVAALAEHGITSGKLLRGVDRRGQVADEITADQVNDVVKMAARRARLPDYKGYSAHSLRAGGATEAYHHGATVSAIAEHGRWAKNSPVVLGYIRSVDKWKDNPMRGIGI